MNYPVKQLQRRISIIRYREQQYVNRNPLGYSRAVRALQISDSKLDKQTWLKGQTSVKGVGEL